MSFSLVSFQERRRGDWGRVSVWKEATASTQDDARTALLAGSAGEGDVFGAEEQTRGRGRWGRTWAGRPGLSLLFTVLVLDRRAPGPLSQVPLVMGVGVAEALAGMGAPGVRLRWPNDVILAGCKAGGLLVEQAGPGLLVGLGLNVGQDLADFEPALRGIAGSLRLAGLDPPREEVLAAVLEGMERSLATWREGGFEGFKARWGALAEGLGEPWRIHPLSGPAWEGLALGLEGDGSLRFRLADGTERAVSSVEVERLGRA